MTIRYTCNGCESVLKIKDEKAGTKARCPKCKNEFVVPAVERNDADEAEIEIASDAPVDEPADSVDMPIELTPDVPDSSEFDPLSVLAGPASSPVRKPGTGSGNAGGLLQGDRKPSVAEMMKDFDASKKKDRDRKSSPEMAKPAAVSSGVTTGSAADALSRAYQQKRDSASGPAYNAKAVKAAEERELLTDFVRKVAVPGILAFCVLGYGYYWWMTREPYIGVPLYEVTGQVLRAGKPASGMRIMFEPAVADPTTPGRVVSSHTDAEGKFRLMADAVNSGAPAGDYNVSVMDENGLPVARPEGLLTVTVSEKDKNEFKINF